MEGRINDRWIRIPEALILRKFRFIPVTWGVVELMAPGPRYYLFGGPYAYPYSLPLEVCQRLAVKLNEARLMFDWQAWRDEFIAGPGYNDAGDYGVTVSKVEGALYEAIGVHHLTPEENRGLHHIFIDVLDENNQRDTDASIKWTWVGRAEPGDPNPIYIDKPANEIPSLPFFGTTINIWHPNGDGVIGLSANHPDERGPNGELWNTVGHHSFMVVFRKVGSPPPPPPPEPPAPGATIGLVGTLQVTVNQAAVAAMRPDAEGNVTIMIEVRG